MFRQHIPYSKLLVEVLSARYVGQAPRLASVLAAQPAACSRRQTNRQNGIVVATGWVSSRVAPNSCQADGIMR